MSKDKDAQDSQSPEQSQNNDAPQPTPEAEQEPLPRDWGFDVGQRKEYIPNDDKPYFIKRS